MCIWIDISDMEIPDTAEHQWALCHKMKDVYHNWDQTWVLMQGAWPLHQGTAEHQWVLYQKMKDVYQHWDEACVAELGWNMCTRGSRGHAPGKLWPVLEEQPSVSECRAIGTGLKLVSIYKGTLDRLTKICHICKITNITKQPLCLYTELRKRHLPETAETNTARNKHHMVNTC